MNKPLKVEFAQGCFDNFEGTQEELQELIAHIHQSVQDGSFLKDAVPLFDLDDEEIDKLINAQPRQ